MQIETIFIAIDCFGYKVERRETNWSNRVVGVGS